jgi:asparagine synthase (glutamine-hydrolysing)
MCGIAGYLHFDVDNLTDSSRLKKMTDVIAHRGPDGEGFYMNNNVALGHRRLSIIDLETGDQPMFSSDKKIALIFNGEIYNYIELREELVKLGHSFHTNSDTEVIIKSYEQWDTNCLLRFNGAWAFALWDDNKKRLFLAHDRISEKPLFYNKFKNSFVFGSEIKSLLAYGVPAIPDLEMTELYLTLINVPAPYTFYKNIRQLQPGHFILIKNKIIRDQIYWSLPVLDESNMLVNKKIVYQKFDELFFDSVRIRMRSDVPYGLFLSGGLDSSSVLALMSEISDKPVETFTCGFNNPFFDERHLATLVSKKFCSSHHQGEVNKYEFDSVIKKVMFHYDTPFGDSSAIPTGYISQFAKKYVKMVLTGDGGDEALSGYVSFSGIKLTEYYNHLPSFVKSSTKVLLNQVSGLLKNSRRYDIDKIIKACEISELNFNSRMIFKFPTTNLKNVKELFPSEFKRFTIEEYFSQVMLNCPYKDDFYKLMYYDLMHSLPDDILTKVDRMSMASSLEARIPFLDYRIIELLVMTHKNVKMQGLQRKSILRNTVGKKLPTPLLRAPKKGFGIPLREWFKEEEFKDQLGLLVNLDFGLDSSTISKIIRKNNSGIEDNGNFIWMLFLLKEWLLK